LLGWGIGGWSMYYYSEDNRVYPHNLVLEVLVEEGLLGFITLAYLLMTVSKTLRSNLEIVEEHCPYLLPLWIYLVLITMFSGDIDDNRFVWFWCAAVLAGCSLAQKSVALNQLFPNIEQERYFKAASPLLKTNNKASVES
jgi:O-antigen ligase